MRREGGNWGCIVASLLILVALGVVYVGRGCRFTAPGNSTPGGTPASKTLAITVQTSETYADMVRNIVEEWNRDPQHQPRVEMLPLSGSRETMQQIVFAPREQPRPDIWLASSARLIEDGSVVPRQTYLDLADSRYYQRLSPQPLAFLVRMSKQEAITPLLQRPVPLAALPRGRFHYSCPDVLVSSGGDSAMRYLKWTFQQSKKPGQTFQQFLEQQKTQGMVRRLDDSGPLAANFVADTELDFILIHNPLADRECQKHPDQVVKRIPTPTHWEQPAAIVLRSGRERHGERVQEFFAFLTDRVRRLTMPLSASLPDTGDVNREKRIWEIVFNGGRCLKR